MEYGGVPHGWLLLLMGVIVNPIFGGNFTDF